jgi:cation transport ATPase
MELARFTNLNAASKWPIFCGLDVLDIDPRTVDMPTQPTKSTDPLIICAYWMNLLLSIVAVLLSVFLGILLLNSSGGGSASIWIIFPFVYAGLALLYQEVLARAYRRRTEQFSLMKLVAIAAAGAISLVSLFYSILSAPDDTGSIVVIPFLIGCLSCAAVCKITSAKYNAHKATRATP